MPEALQFLTRQPCPADGLRVSRCFKGEKEIFIFYRTSGILNISTQFEMQTFLLCDFWWARQNVR